MQDDIKKAIKSYYEMYFEIGYVYEELAKMHGLTSTTLFILQMIYDYPEECTQHFICEKLLYPKQTVNTILDSFERKGYIRKEVSKLDKRNKNILFTEAGKKYAVHVMSDMFQLEESAFTSMTTEDREAMVRGEQAFLVQLKKIMQTFRETSSAPIIKNSDRL